MQRTCAFLFFVLGVLAAATAAPNDAFAAADALMDYVAKPDDSYTWSVHARYREGDSEIIELRLHSQTWREILWKHQLYIIKPSRVATEHQGLLIVGGGRWRESYETAEPSRLLPDGADLFLAIAEQLQTVVAVIGQVPFQPLLILSQLGSLSIPFAVRSLPSHLKETRPGYRDRLCNELAPSYCSFLAC